MSFDPNDQFIYTGLIRLHILYHAAKEPFYGMWMKEELEEHGYRIGPGTLYPLLRGLEKRGFLSSFEKREGKVNRVYYKATPEGRKALKAAKARIEELYSELCASKKKRIHRKV